MKEKSIFIKEKHPDLFTKGFTLLGLMIASLICAFAPLLVAGFKNNKSDFYIVGGLLFFVFLALFVRLILKEFHPSNRLILKANGFYDKKSVGADIVIAWTNVASVKLLGDEDMPYLGITLDNSDIVMAKMKKQAADEMRDNIDDNLPHILIAQNEVYTPLNELKETFLKYIREARVLDRDVLQKQKNNPFSSDDVLRAFGQLPPEDKNEDENPIVEAEEHTDKKVNTIVYDTVSDSHDSEDQEESADKSDTEENIEIGIHTDENQNSSIDFPDSFYEILSSQENIDDETVEDNAVEDNAVKPLPEDNNVAEADDTIDTDPQPINEKTVSNEEYSADLSEEINEFLSNIKFSKITEINNILNNPDVPYSLSREENRDDKKTEADSNEPEQNIDVSQESIEQEVESIQIDSIEQNSGITSLNDEIDVCIEFPADEFEEDITSNDDITFENLFLETKIFDDKDSADSDENQ